MKIGPYQLANNVIAAPMAGVTDSCFRRLCHRFGAGMVVSEMVSANPALWQSKKSIMRQNHDDESYPRTVQIAGGEPQLMADAARYNVDKGAQIIDINMGCPMKKVCNKAAGSALMKNEMLASQILEAVVRAVEVPVTLKMRTGWDENNRNAEHLAYIAEQSGIAAISIHGRTRANRFNGYAEYETIKQIKSASNIPIIANGDIDSPQKAKFVLEFTGADGIMIGRAAQGQPWIFNTITHYLSTGELLPAPNEHKIRSVLEEHLQSLYSLYGEYTGLRVARKHVAWYCDKNNVAFDFKQRFNKIDTAKQQLEMIKNLV